MRAPADRIARVILATRRPVAWVPALVGLAVLAASLGLGAGLRQQERAQAEQVARMTAADLVHHVVDRVDGRVLPLLRIARDWTSRGRPARAAFHGEALGVLTHHPDVAAIAWVEGTGTRRWTVRPERSQAAEALLDLPLPAGGPYAVPRVQVVSHPTGGAALRLVVPVARAGRGDGAIVAVLDERRLFAPIVEQHRSFGVALQLLAAGRPVWALGDAVGDPAAAEASADRYGVTWQVRAALEGGPGARGSTTDDWVLAVGVVLSLLLGLAVRLAMTSAANARESQAARLRLETEMTERGRAEEALRDSEARFKRAFEDAPIGMALMAIDGRFLRVNRALCEIVGYREADLLARTFQEVTHPDDLEADLDLSRRLVAGEIREYQIEKRYVRRDGRPVWVLLSSSLVRDERGEPLYAIAQIQDISRAKRDEAVRRMLLDELDAERARLEAVVSQLPVGVILAEAPSGRLVLANAQAAAILGHAVEPADGFADYPSGRVYGPEGQLYAPEELPLARALNAGEVTVGEANEYARDDGSRALLRVSAAPIRGRDGRVVAAVLILDDVTESRRLEGRLRESQKMEAVGRLAGGVAHEFNNLMTIVTGFAEVLDARLARASPFRDDVSQIREAGERATRLTRQLLAFGRRQHLVPRETDLSALVRDAAMLLRRLAGPTVRVELRLAPEPCLALVDPGRIEEAIVYLALNARDAMPQGGTLTVTTALEEGPEVDGAPLGPCVRLEVADTGRGMDEETRRHIFEPFYTTKGLANASGLGLSAVYGIVRQSGGHAAVESRPGEGTRIVIHLPHVGGAKPAARGDQAPRVAGAAALT